jgi:hypothetical protein
LQDPRETQIGNRLGYIGHMVTAWWVGMGATTHRLLLPDAWGRVSAGQRREPTFYLVQPPDLPVRDLTIRAFAAGRQHGFVERWRGLLYYCPPGASCAAPNLDPRLFARYTAILRVDQSSGLPVSMTTVVQRRGRAGGRFVWGPVQPLAETTFHYGDHFSISFVKG